MGSHRGIVCGGFLRCMCCKSPARFGMGCPPTQKFWLCSVFRICYFLNVLGTVWLCTQPQKTRHPCRGFCLSRRPVAPLLGVYRTLRKSKILHKSQIHKILCVWTIRRKRGIFRLGSISSADAPAVKNANNMHKICITKPQKPVWNAGRNRLRKQKMNLRPFVNYVQKINRNLSKLHIDINACHCYTRTTEQPIAQSNRNLNNTLSGGRTRWTNLS